MLHTHEVTGSSPVVSTKKKTHPEGWVFLFDMAFEIRTRTQLNATVRWTVARDGWTERNLNFCPLGKNANRVLLSPPSKIPIHTDGDFCLAEIRHRTRTFLNRSVWGHFLPIPERRRKSSPVVSIQSPRPFGRGLQSKGHQTVAFRGILCLICC